jgi:hypothetical protein
MKYCSNAVLLVGLVMLSVMCCCRCCCLRQVGDNVILADEMGLGKTIQTIAFLGALWKVRRLCSVVHCSASNEA